MQKRRKILTVILALLMIVALVIYWQSQNHKMMLAEVSSSNGARYAIELPNDFEPAHINDSLASISLQYENVKRDLHIMVIDESKAKIISFGLDYDLDTYMKIATRAIDKDGVYPNKTFILDGNHAIQTEIKADTKGKKVIYKLTCVETPKYFYQILEWTPEASIDKNRDEMTLMVQSFKDIGK